MNYTKYRIEDKKIKKKENKVWIYLLMRGGQTRARKLAGVSVSIQRNVNNHRFHGHP